jgi:cellulose synthase/poly-beta-1,6-N-acetylglucosamine synthase-like glycosyltransferase
MLQAMFTSLLFWWSLTGLVIHLVMASIMARASSQVRRLSELADEMSEETEWPRVSLVIPARNEERNIREALGSVLQLDYPRLEILAVDDRSTDGTGAILDDFAAEDPRLRVEHIQELPPGWLGKNHALHRAAAQASGDFLLFTDADVVMDDDVLRRAVAHMEREQLDHLALAPYVEMPGLLLQSFAITFTVFLSAYFRPWKARDPKSSAYIGIGAFNLIRTRVYRELRGHELIAMRPDDDMMLGRIIKRHGYRQDFADATDKMSVPWYGSIREMTVGLEKNLFSGVDYRLSVIVVSSLIALLFNVAPFLMVWLTSGIPRAMFGGSVAILLLASLGAAQRLRLPRSAALLFPLAVLLFLFVQWRATWLTLTQQGIRWRDTFYPLAELKANRVK